MGEREDRKSFFFFSSLLDHEDLYLNLMCKATPLGMAMELEMQSVTEFLQLGRKCSRA